jgi:hypothetical protein
MAQDGGKVVSLTVRNVDNLTTILGSFYHENRWLEVSIRKVLRPATSTHAFLGLPVSKSKF